MSTPFVITVNGLTPSGWYQVVALDGAGVSWQVSQGWVVAPPSGGPVSFSFRWQTPQTPGGYTARVTDNASGRSASTGFTVSWS